MQQRRSRRPLLRVHHNPRLKRSPSVAVKDRSRRSSASPRCQPPRKRTSQRQSPLRARAVKSQLAPDWLIANVNDCETAEPASTRSLPPPPHGRRRLVPRPPTGGRLGVRMSRICKPDRRPRRTRSCQPPPRPATPLVSKDPTCRGCSDCHVDFASPLRYKRHRQRPPRSNRMPHQWLRRRRAVDCLIADVDHR